MPRVNPMLKKKQNKKLGCPVCSTNEKNKRREVLFFFHTDVTCTFPSLPPNDIKVDAILNASCSQ